MRITGGKSKGRHLSSLKGRSVRPTSDKVREAIFNLIGQDITGLKVLDLFAGTGSLGIEALSRGAVFSLFIDYSRLSVKVIQKNLILCDYKNSGFILKKDLRNGLPTGHPMFKEGFDLVFIDPPYGKDLIHPVLKELSNGEILVPTAIVVTESFKTDALPFIAGDFHQVDTRIYGKTKIDIYSRGEI
jgi:16S rRNA (guanine966-N2)-methyltransferase